MTLSTASSYEHFIRIPHTEIEALERGDINRIMFDILGLIHLWCNFYTGIASSVSAQRIADHLGYDNPPSLNTVRRYLHALIDSGWIRWDYRPHCTERTYSVWLCNYPNMKLLKNGAGSTSREGVSGSVSDVLNPSEIKPWRETSAFQGSGGHGVFAGGETASSNQTEEFKPQDSEKIPATSDNPSALAAALRAPLGGLPNVPVDFSKDQNRQRQRSAQEKRNLAADADRLALFVKENTSLLYPVQKIEKALAAWNEYDVTEIEDVIADYSTGEEKIWPALKALFAVGNLKTAIQSYRIQCARLAAAEATKLRDQENTARQALARADGVNYQIPNSVRYGINTCRVSDYGVVHLPGDRWEVCIFDVLTSKIESYPITQSFADQLRDEYLSTHPPTPAAEPAAAVLTP